jgi:hypothetical protein
MGSRLLGDIMQMIFIGRGRLSILYHYDGLSPTFPRIPIPTWQLTALCVSLCVLLVTERK